MIINCKECQSKVSDASMTCPKCGVSFPGVTDKMGDAIERDSKYRAWLWVPGILFFGSILACIYDVYIGHVLGEDLSLISVATYAPYTVAGVWLYIVGEIWRNIMSR